MSLNAVAKSPRQKKVHFINAVAFVATIVMVKPSISLAGDAERRPALLVNDFVKALQTYGDSGEAAIGTPTPGVSMWLQKFSDLGVDPQFIARRLQKAKARAEARANLTARSGLLESVDPFAAYRFIKVEKPVAPAAEFEAMATPIALHAFRLDVLEDYDDVMNDDVYGYFIVTHDDVLWGKVTSIYRDLDEGTAVFLSPIDRGIFGPSGDKLIPKNQTVVDFGLIESDSDDIDYLKRVSDSIVDLALTAVAVYNPEAGAAAAQAREETKNLMRLIVELDGDDRLVADTLRFTPDSMMSLLSDNSVAEFSRDYSRQTAFTRFHYRMNFRILR